RIGLLSRLEFVFLFVIIALSLVSAPHGLIPLMLALLLSGILRFVVYLFVLNTAVSISKKSFLRVVAKNLAIILPMIIAVLGLRYFLALDHLNMFLQMFIVALIICAFWLILTRK